MRGTERERQRPRQREKQAPRREPDAGLDPGSSGAGDTKPLRHRGWPAVPPRLPWIIKS